jgi:hypothetical protein
LPVVVRSGANHKGGFMIGKERKFVLDVIDQEGFEYSFEHYSDFKEVADKRFHELKDAYLKAKEDLKSYIEQ